MARPLRIFVSAGEESGDRHGAELIARLLELHPSAEICGIGGKRMAAAGCRLVADPTDLAVMWFVDVFKNLRTFVRLFERSVRTIGKWKPDVVVPIDYPGFNLRLADRAKGLDIPVAYYISPQVWAWWPGRVYRIAEVVDKMIVIFPFERGFYQEVGVQAFFVGHPVSDRFRDFQIDPAVRTEIGLPENSRLVALLPGSRRSEVRRNLPLMLEAASRMVDGSRGRSSPDPIPVQFASAFNRPRLAALATDLASGFPHPYAVIQDKVHHLMAASHLALVCAGSATVELAYLGIPMVVLYKVPFPSYLLSLLLNRSPHIAMANLLAGKRVVPEFLTWRFQPQRIAEEALPLLEEGPERRSQMEAFSGIRQVLGGPGASLRAAEIVLDTARAHRRRTEINR
ncbi:MAG: lipid-A-disaccharide synthase [Planctomycetota bacterium]|jgi:lipid-A-disaccharide synthase